MISCLESALVHLESPVLQRLSDNRGDAVVAHTLLEVLAVSRDYLVEQLVAETPLGAH